LKVYSHTVYSTYLNCLIAYVTCRKSLRSDMLATVWCSAVRHDTPATSGNHRAIVLFQTRFKNNTKADQSYTMRTEKKTRTSMTTCVEHGFTKGIEMGVKLMTPGEVRYHCYYLYQHVYCRVMSCDFFTSNDNILHFLSTPENVPIFQQYGDDCSLQMLP